MPLRQWIFIVILTSAISVFVGCGGSTFNVQNPPPPPPQNVTITFASTPPTGISLGGTVSLTANVTNDPDNEGVDWTVSCANQQTFGCGTFSSPHTASGQAVTFTPPTSFAGNNTVVTIVAYSTYSPQTNTSAGITITAFGSVLQGTYVFQARGNDSTFSFGYPYQLVGELYLDGNGNVAAAPGGTFIGQQTINTYDADSILDSTTTAITGGNYFVGTDGRGTLTVNTTDAYGDTIVEDFSLVVISSSEVSLAQLSGTLTNSSGSTTLAQSSTGTMSLQNSAAAGALPSAGFAFAGFGTDSTGTPIAYGGVININGAGGTISGAGSLADQGYNGGTVTCSPPNGFAGSSVASTGTSGVVLFNLVTACSGGNFFGPSQLLGYIIDATHIQLIETDGGFLTSGLAVGQGSSTGTLTSFSGNYIFDTLGMDLTSLIPSSLTSVDVINADGSGNITSGYTDTAFFSNADGSPAVVSSQLTGLYQLDTKGIGRVHLRMSPPPVPFFDPSIVMYLTAPAGTAGAPALVLYSTPTNKLYPALGVGIAYPQAQPPQSLNFGNGELYGLTLTQENGTESDGSGQMTASSSSGGGTLTGVEDNSIFGFQVAPQTLTGSFGCPPGAPTCPDQFGRFSNSNVSVGGTVSGVDYFLIDNNNGFIIETDSVNTDQVSLGSFTERCDVTVSGNCGQAGVKAKRKRSSRTK